MTDNDEVERYIKCSDCRCKYKNDDTNIAHDFGYNRLGEKFKTCVICRDKRKKKRNNSNKEEKQNNDKDEEDKAITNEHYEEIDKELRSKYDEEFKIDSHDNTMGLFTEDEQVDRYARMLFFWDINQVLNNDDVINDPKLTAKYFYISNMRCELNKKMMTIFDDRVQKLIFKRYRKLAEIHNQKLIVEQFTKRNKYPKYNEVVKIISDKLDVYAEYGGCSHEWMGKIWNDINNEKKIRVIGNLINGRGGFQAMSKNHTALVMVVRHFLKKEKLTDIDNMIILQSIYKGVERAWDGIGDWKR